MSEDKLGTAIYQAGHADALLKSELLNQTFDYLESEYVKAWRVMPAKDTDGREKLWLAVNVIGKVRDHLQKVLNDGKLAKADIDRLTQKQG